jgi:hypothetical protein
MNDSLSSPKTPKFRIVFVVGLGRSGSTLLGRLLHNHKSVVDVGELLRLDLKVDEPGALCACGIPLSECPDWKDLMEGIPGKVQRNYRKWTPDLLNRVRENSGADVLVDVSKTRAYRLAKRWQNPEVGFILLLRDPRGILRSHVAAGKSVDDKLKLHRKWMKRYHAFAKKKANRCHLMYYEDLASNPETSMRKVCDFIGIDFQPKIVVPNTENLHMPVYSTSDYLKGTGELRLDERWRTEMDSGVISNISKSLQHTTLYETRYQLSKDV